MSEADDLAHGRLCRLYYDQELRLAVYASNDPDCQWLAAWFTDELKPALRTGQPGTMPLPSPAFAAKLKKIIAVARSEIASTPAVWSPGPREPLLPGDWPEQAAPRRSRRRRK